MALGQSGARSSRLAVLSGRVTVQPGEPQAGRAKSSSRGQAEGRANSREDGQGDEER